MKEYLKNKFKKFNKFSIRGKGSDGDEQRKRARKLQANADALGDQFTRLMPPLANDLLLSSAQLTTSDLISEGPLQGFVDQTGAACTPLEATYLNGTVVAEPNIQNTTVENLNFNNISGVKYDHEQFVSGRLNNYVKELNKRFLHKEPIVSPSWIEGLGDPNGLFGSNRSYRGARVEPLQDINKILNCNKSTLRNTAMRWGPGMKHAATTPALINTSEIDLAPNQMVKRYLGAGFKKSPYAYRKIYHPNNITKRKDFLAPEQGDYTFSEDHPVLYQGSYDFGCSITGNGYLHRSFCSRAFFKYLANPTEVGNGGDYFEHQRWIKAAFGIATDSRYASHASKFATNGKPGKYVFSLAAQAEPEGLKEPIIDSIAQKINNLGIDYFKPIRFHESYTGRYVNGETAKDSSIVSFKVSNNGNIPYKSSSNTRADVDNYTVDDSLANFEPNGTVNGSTAWKDFSNNHSITKLPVAGGFAWLYNDDDSSPQFVSPTINGATSTSVNYPWNVDGVLTNDQEGWSRFVDTDGDGNTEFVESWQGGIPNSNVLVLTFSNFVTENGNDHWSYVRHDGGGNNGISRTAFAPTGYDGITKLDTGICTYNGWYSHRILVKKATIAGKICEKLEVVNSPSQEAESAPTSAELAEIRLSWEIVDVGGLDYEEIPSSLLTNIYGDMRSYSWRLSDIEIIKAGKNYIGTPTLVVGNNSSSFETVSAYSRLYLDSQGVYRLGSTSGPIAVNQTPGSLPTATFTVGAGGRIIGHTITNAGRVAGRGGGYSYSQDGRFDFYYHQGTSPPSTTSSSITDVDPQANPSIPADARAILSESTLPGTSGNAQRWYKPNKDYKITGQIYIPSSNNTADRFRFRLEGDSTQGVGAQNIPNGYISGGSTNFPKDQWRPFDLEFTNSGSNNFRKMSFSLFDGTSQTIAPEDYIAIKDFSVFEKTVANESPPKDYRIAYMAFNAEDFFANKTTPFQDNKEVNFAVDGNRLDVGDPNGLNFLFPEVKGFDLTTRAIRESITLKQVTAADVCGSRFDDDMKYPFVTGASNLSNIGYKLSESKSSKFKGTFLWPVYLGDKLKPLNKSNKLVNTGKLFITPNDSATVSGNKLQSGIDNDYDVFKKLNDNTIKYAHIANPNLGAPSSNIIDKTLQVQVQEKAPGIFNFTNFGLNYNLGEETQIPLTNESSTTFEYNKSLFGPNEILKAGGSMEDPQVASFNVTMSRFLYEEIGRGPIKQYRHRVSNVSVTDGGAGYSSNVKLNFNSVQGGLAVYEQPNATVNVSQGVIQSVTFATQEDRGQFEGSGFVFGNYSTHSYDPEAPVVEAVAVDQGEAVAEVSADLSLQTGDAYNITDFNYGMRNYNAIDGTSSADVESDGAIEDDGSVVHTFQSDWMENPPLDQDYVPVTHMVTRKEVDCVKITFIIEELFQEIIQEQDPLGASIKLDGININFSVFCSFEGVPENIYQPRETKIGYYGTVTSFYAVDSQEIILPSYSELLTAFPNEDINSLAALYTRKVEIRKNDFETTSTRLGRAARVFQVKEIVKEKFQYPFSAIIKSTVDARTFREVPNRQFRMKLKKIKVPSNYYPLNLDGSDKRFVDNANNLGTRIIYDGDWDGTFKIAWTDNPAWILYDLMINQRYGIGNRIDNLEDINIFNLYKIGRYCDAVDDNGNFVGLDNGMGGLEPRFSCNIMIEASQNAFKTINDICTVFNGMAFYANGRLDFFADQPKEPMMFFNNANVFDGIFNYQSTNKSSQFNMAEITFLDKNDDFTPKKETIMDEVSMRENGLLRRDINAKGATSRGQAARLGRYILYTNKFEREIVNFKAGSDSLMLSIGDIIEIQDELKNFETSFGKVLNLNTDGDKFLEIESGPDVDSILTNHSGAFVMAPTGQDKLTDLYDNLLEGEPVDNDVLSGLYTTQAQKLKITGVKESNNKIKIGVEDTNGYLDLVQTGSFVNLDMQNKNTRQYRVLKINPEESNLYAISATEHSKEKFDLIEAPVDFKIDEEDSYNIGIPKNTINTVTEPLEFETSLHTSHTLEQTIRFKIIGDITGNESAYQLTVIRPNGKIANQIIPKGNLVGSSFVTSGEVAGGATGLDTSFGTYNFEVTSKSSEEIFGTAPVSTFGDISTLYESNYAGFSATDSDNDGLTDYAENIIHRTDPYNADTDEDGRPDGDEVTGKDGHFTDPVDRDTDDGGLSDGFEITAGSDPNDPSDDETAANPFITGFRIRNAPSAYLTLPRGVGGSRNYSNMGGMGPNSIISRVAPDINGLYEISGDANGNPFKIQNRPVFVGQRNYPSRESADENYISVDNPYKPIYAPGAAIVRYHAASALHTQGYWSIETNTPQDVSVFQNAAISASTQKWTGGAGTNYPWEVTNWKALNTTTFLNVTVDLTDQPQPEIFFKYLSDGTVIGES